MPKEGVSSPGAGIMGGWEPFETGAGSQTWVLHGSSPLSAALSQLSSTHPGLFDEGLLTHHLHRLNTETRKVHNLINN